MSLKDLGPNIPIEYQTLRNDVIQDFYIPCLSESVKYDRAVGFFSSSILLQITQGLAMFAKNGGKMRLIISPRLEKKDYEAISAGYDMKKIAEDKVSENFDELIEFEQKKDRFALLAYMIRSNLLDIKIAVLEEKNDKEMFHEKLGLMYDSYDNIVAFSGSANETITGYNKNYENIDIFCSWKSDDADLRCHAKVMRFERMWNQNEVGLITIPFPEVVKNKILSYENTVYFNNENIFRVDENFLENYKKQKKSKEQNIPTLSILKSEGQGLRDYQIEAIDKWESLDFKGIYDMATGTGKTFTACGSIVRLFEKKGRCIAVICCPYIHLVEQWYEEVKKFGIKAIRCYGNINYETDLKRQLTKYKQKRSDFVCLIFANRTFCSLKNQELLLKNLDSTLLIVDEAHNFGADSLADSLKINYPYRLALSATLDRFGDEEGTRRLYDFFGEKCISYSLEKAILDHKLTEYEYHPVPVFLEPDERDRYYELTKEIQKMSSYATLDNKKFKLILLKRAKLIAGAHNKVSVLIDKLKGHENDRNMLIYCGAVKYGEDGYEHCDDEISQIREVVRLLYKERNIHAHEFTSSENIKERKEIIDSFKSSDGLQALVAIKCLDEGMDIPAIKTAYILASSTNPKEYIQRRGRVLRKYPGKDHAVIYDFITLPTPLNKVKYLSNDEMKMDKTLIEKEFNRLFDFRKNSSNSSECNEFVNDVKSAYGMFTITEDL